jgi:hypothetical protein
VTDAWLYAVARADDRAWIAGTNAVLFRDGATWEPAARGAVPVLRAVAAESGSGAILAGGENGYLARGAGDRWHMEDTGDMRTIHDLWESDDGEMFAVGTNRILRREGAMWVVESGEIGEFFDIDGREDAIFAVGSEGRIRMRTPSGWSHFGKLTPLAIYGIAVGSANEAYAVGEGGWIGRYNGITWQSMTSFTSRDLFDVIAMPGNDPRAVAVGDGGVIRALVVPPGVWYDMPGPTTVALHALAFGPGGDLYAAGGGGIVLRLRGTAWEIVPTPTGRTLLATCSRNGTLFVAGGDEVGGAVLLRYGSLQ